jgi:hypothetical protein
LHRVTEYSQQRRIIDTLQRREAQLAEAQHIAKIGSWEWDVQSDVVTWSDELYTPTTRRRSPQRSPRQPR